RNTTAQISGGQQQRVAVARALAMNPALLLADEPTGNLDTRTGDEIIELFQELNDEGSTIVIVTHDPEVATRTKRTIWLRDGLVESDERQVPVKALPAGHEANHEATGAPMATSGDGPVEPAGDRAGARPA